jgi:tetratricopeptide (TPR) repeat protein
VLPLLIALVLATVLVTHWPALSAKALYFDDEQYLTQNQLVQHPSASAAWRFISEVTKPSTVEGYYQPLAMISLMLDTAIGGRTDYLRPYHRTSLALHLANTGLIIIFLYLLFRNPWVAAAVGLLYGVHPLTVEPIPWVGERKTLLASFFALIALVAYVKYCGLRIANYELINPKSEIRNPKSWYIICIVCYVLSLLSKPTTTPVAVLLLLLDYWPLRRLNKSTIMEKIPFFAIAGISSIITILSQGSTAGVVMPGENDSPLRVPFILCHNIVFYLWKVVWPANLSAHYPFPEPMTLGNPVVLVGVLGSLLLIAILLVSIRWTRALMTSWLFFFLAIFPTLGVIGFTIVIASDKYAYFPMVGLLLPPAYFLSKLWSGRRRIGILAAVLLLASVEALATHHYYGFWRDTDTLYGRAVALAPRSAIVHYNAANNLAQEGHVDDAIVLYRKTLNLDPNYAQAHNGLALELMSQGKDQEAMQHFEAALALKPDSAEAENNMGNFLLKAGKLEDAIRHCNKALQLKPEFPQAHHNLGDAYLKAGQLDEAIKHYREAVRLKPASAADQFNLAFALSKQEQFVEAITHYELAAQYRPGFTKAHVNMALALDQLGRLNESIEEWRKARALEPADGYLCHKLGAVLIRAGRLDEGLKEFREAARLAPNDPEIYYQFAESLAGLGRIDDAIKQCEVALKVKADYAPAHSSLSALWLAKGNLNEAMSHAEKAVQIDPHFVEGHINLAVVLTKQGQVDRALGEFKEALRLDPRNVAARNNLGIMLQEHGKSVEAADQFREVLKIDPLNREALKRLQAVESAKTSAPGP